MNAFHLYRDIETRTKGEIYIGVVGPVRTGKSTFIKRFMDVLVLPHMEDGHDRTRTRDELPQSASGTAVMTTEPKFVPKEAASIQLEDDVTVKVRLIDCVGYMVEGASGYMEKEMERQVKTPWFDEEIPFTRAAAIGTRKVICDHSTIGIVVTTDGSIGEIPRGNYLPAEERTIQELKTIGKPFVVLVNTKKPYGEEAARVAEEIQEKYKVTALAVNCEQLREEDIHRIMEQVLFAFPVSEVRFFIPKWTEMLPRDNKIKEDLLSYARKVLEGVEEIRDVTEGIPLPESSYIEEAKIREISMDTGTVSVDMSVREQYYYEMLSEVTGTDIRGEYDLLGTIKELSALRKEYEAVKDAMEAVKQKGYGVVSPGREEIRLEEPVIIRQGSRFGVKIHSEAPSIHMIRANIETEIAPIVGNEQQAKDLIQYIKTAASSEEGVWGTSIFGKSIEELVLDGIRNKIAMINEESQAKLQDTMQKIVNDSTGGMVCIII
ncbi:MAG TPA: stage IV sporulation protein A [Candidatus Bariatricus faecipullorum]|nr:stage IV sporulation protein A [Candidatus Bariatricus faecipullorum]